MHVNFQTKNFGLRVMGVGGRGGGGEGQREERKKNEVLFMWGAERCL